MGDETRVDNLTLKSYDGSTWKTEAVDTFDNISGYAQETPTYDNAGNQTYDGQYRYTYDAWNHMTQVARAFRVNGGPIQTGSTIATMSYDGLGRRIVKTVTNSADWDATYVTYYNGWSDIEDRNGSGQVLRQQVWGARYVDELVQVATNANPGQDDDSDPANGTQDTCEGFYYPMQDANWNVVGLIDGTAGSSTAGKLIERYTFTPYGQRTVYVSSGSNDPLCMSPATESSRVLVSNASQSYGLCDFSHQGLYFDKEYGLIYDRNRILDPVDDHFLTRDPAGYADGTNVYGYVGSNPVVNSDPSGLWHRVEGEDYIWESDTVKDKAKPETFIDLINELNKVSKIKNGPQAQFCLRPRPDMVVGENADKTKKQMEAFWGQGKPAPCGRYDVSNLLDALPEGNAVQHAVADDTGSLRLARFLWGPGNWYMKPSEVYAELRTASGSGKTPISIMELCAHGEAGSRVIGPRKQNKDNWFDIKDIPGTLRGPVPWARAVEGEMPIVGWFRHDARVSLFACETYSMAESWSGLLRQGAIAYGTTVVLWHRVVPSEWGCAAFVNSTTGQVTYQAIPPEKEVIQVGFRDGGPEEWYYSRATLEMDNRWKPYYGKD